METISGYPYFRVEFTKDGQLFKPEQRQAILDGLSGTGVTDLYFASHGFNNDIADAQNLYELLFACVRRQQASSRAKDRKFGVVGIFWPSKKFADEGTAGGGVASFGEGGVDVHSQLDLLASLLNRDHLPEHDAAASDPDVDRAKAAAAKLQDPDADQAAAKGDFVDAIRAIFHRIGAPDSSDSKDDGTTHIMNDSAEDLFEALAVPPRILPPGSDENAGGTLDIGDVEIGGGGGQTAGIGGFFRSLADRARDLANLATFYSMKKRAGTVGESGVGPLVNDVHAKLPNLRIHFVGHSFGGRLVTAAAKAVASPVSSVALLQAAYSHNGLGDNGQGLVGAFRGVVTGHKVNGPIVITHTHNDLAVGTVYAIASRLSGDNVSAFVGGADDQFGGMGSNGALNANANTQFKLTPGVPKDYAFQGGQIYNLNSDAVITGHSDIKKDEVACAMLAAAAT